MFARLPLVSKSDGCARGALSSAVGRPVTLALPLIDLCGGEIKEISRKSREISNRAQILLQLSHKYYYN